MALGYKIKYLQEHMAYKLRYFLNNAVIQWNFMDI